MFAHVNGTGSTYAIDPWKVLTSWYWMEIGIWRTKNKGSLPDPEKKLWVKAFALATCKLKNINVRHEWSSYQFLTKIWCDDQLSICIASNLVAHFWNKLIEVNSDLWEWWQISKKQHTT